MPEYDRYPGVDANYNFPPEVRKSIANSQEIIDRTKGAVQSGLEDYDKEVDDKLGNYVPVNTTPPNAPAKPVLTLIMGNVNVRATGLDTDGAIMPPDFSHYNVEVDNLKGLGWNVEGGSIGHPEGATDLLGKPAGEIYVRLRAVDISGNVSAIGDYANIVVDPIMTAEEVQAEYQEAQERVDATIATFEGTVAGAVEKAEDAAGAAISAEARATEANNRAMTRLANGNFEDGLKYWKTTGTPELVPDAHSGVQAVQMVAGERIYPESPLPVIEGQIWEANLFYKSLEETVPEGSSGLQVTVTRPGEEDLPNPIAVFALPHPGTEWKNSGTLRLTVPADVDQLSFRIVVPWVNPATFIVDDVALRDVTDVVRLEAAANAARQKAEAAESLAESVRLAQDGPGGIKDILSKNTQILEAAGVEGASDLATLDERLTNAFKQADNTIKESADNAAQAAAEAKEAAVAAALLRIDSSRGTTFKNNTISTVLTVTIFYAGATISNITQLHEAFGMGAYLEWFWRRERDDEFGLISSADNRLSNAGFALTVSPADVDEKTIFQCYLNA